MVPARSRPRVRAAGAVMAVASGLAVNQAPGLRRVAR